MEHYLLDIDEEQADLLIDMLRAAIALADHESATNQATRVYSVGSPVLEDLLALRRQRVSAEP
jgi:hypothetical protein